MDFFSAFGLLLALAACIGLIRGIWKTAQEDKPSEGPSAPLPGPRGLQPFWIDDSDGEIFGVVSVTGTFVFLSSYQKKVGYIWPFSRLSEGSSPMSREEWWALVGKCGPDGHLSTLQRWGNIIANESMSSDEKRAALRRLGFGSGKSHDS